eukprot:c6984_g1_i1.p1 GENE.c6984_g1_i1~~c6984_g1_i1.p1  ORF type:complete len:449 (-),score=80.81 c6984_g1_i1:151-1497(-)
MIPCRQSHTTLESWESTDCPPRALCIPSNDSFKCSCEFSMDMLASNSEGECVPTLSTNLFFSFWVVVSIYLFVSLCRLLALLIAAKTRKLLKRDALGIASIFIALALTTLTITTVLRSAITIQFSTSRTFHKHLSLALVLSDSLFMLCLFVCLVFFALSSLAMLLRSFDLSQDNAKSDQRKAICASLFCGLSVFAVLLPLLLANALAIAAAIVSIMTIFCLGLFRKLSVNLKRGSGTIRVTRRNSHSIRVMHSISASAHRIMICAICLLCFTTIFVFAWYRGHEIWDKSLLGPVAAISYALFRLTLVALVTVMLSTVISLLQLRFEKGSTNQFMPVVMYGTPANSVESLMRRRYPTQTVSMSQIETRRNVRNAATQQQPHLHQQITQVVPEEESEESPRLESAIQHSDPKQKIFYHLSIGIQDDVKVTRTQSLTGTASPPLFKRSKTV